MAGGSWSVDRARAAHRSSSMRSLGPNHGQRDDGHDGGDDDGLEWAGRSTRSYERFAGHHM